jgi:GH24 family phage-related lysozyme (muramidase)
MNFDNAISIANDFIAGRESFAPSPYWDVNGYAIGYGNHYYEDGSPVTADDGSIDQARAAELLSFFVRQNANAILSQVSRPLTDNQLAALTSLRYNCGTFTVAILNMINAGAEPAAIADKLRNTCVTSNGAFNESLFKRRELEANLFLGTGGLLSSGLMISLVVAAYFLFKSR